MAKIPNQLIHIAADWIADQERDPFEDLSNVSISMRRPYYYQRVYSELTRVARECEDNDCSIIGTKAPCGRNERGEILFATVVIRGTIVLGYLGFDMTPAFSWPPEIREKIVALAVAQSVAI